MRSIYHLDGYYTGVVHKLRETKRLTPGLFRVLSAGLTYIHELAHYYEQNG